MVPLEHKPSMDISIVEGCPSDIPEDTLVLVRKAGNHKFIFVREHVNETTADEPHSRVWVRAIHSFSILGYGLILSLVIAVWLVLVSRAQWTVNQRGVPTINQWAVIGFICVPIMISFMGTRTSFFTIMRSWHTHVGSSQSARKMIVRGLGWTALGFVLLLALTMGGIDVIYTSIDLIVVAVTISCATRSYMRLRHGDRARKSPRFGLSPGLAAVRVGGLIVVLAYPLWLLPRYFASGTAIRFLICLLVHPLLLEVTEISIRWNSNHSDEDGERISLEVRAKQLGEFSVNSFGFKCMMALIRRFMLLNVGDAQATFIAIAITAIEETVMRAFIVEIDSAVRRLWRCSTLTVRDLTLRRVAWAMDMNHSCLAEIVAIFTSTFAMMLMESHAQVIGIGYDPVSPSVAGLLMVQLLFEICIEVIVDNLAMWTEAEHDIPVRTFFKMLDSPSVAAAHLFFAVMSTSIALYSFIRHPKWTTCSSKTECACLHVPEISEWYAHICLDTNSSSTIVADEKNISIVADAVHLDPFEGVNLVDVLATGTTLLLIVLVVWFSVIFMRNRKRGRIVTEQLKKLKETKKQLASKQAELVRMRSALRAANLKIMSVMQEGGTMLTQCELPYSDLEIFDGSIGEGSFGTVLRGRLRGEHDVAIKTFRIGKITSPELGRFKAELMVMAPLHHQNVVRLFGGCWNEGADRLCIVLEYCALGSLSTLLGDVARKENARMHSHERAQSWRNLGRGLAIDVSYGLRYLHHDLIMPVIHRDVKPDNVLVAEGVIAKLGDFGESTKFDRGRARSEADFNGDDALTMTMVGTRLYCAPEVLSDEKVDTFSFSLVLLCLVVGDIDYIRHAVRISRVNYELNQRPPIPAWVEDNFEGIYHLIKDMWQSDFRLRPRMIDVVACLESS